MSCRSSIRSRVELERLDVGDDYIGDALNLEALTKALGCR
jgi:hypothetical protein